MSNEIELSEELGQEIEEWANHISRTIEDVISRLVKVSFSMGMLGGYILGVMASKLGYTVSTVLGVVIMATVLYIVYKNRGK